MTRINKTAMRKAVNNVFTLIREGHGITKARETIGKELNVSANTLWNWQDRLNMKTPVVTDKLATRNNDIAIPRKITVDPSISKTKDHLGRVLTSLVNKNGEFSTREASAISQVSSGILGFNKHELEVAKFVNKTLRGKDKSIVL